MATVIGLPSGREFLVKDDSYIFTDDHTGTVVRVFESVDSKRIITVPPAGESIEFYDEPNSEKAIEVLKNSIGLKPEVKVEYDVSIV